MPPTDLHASLLNCSQDGKALDLSAPVAPVPGPAPEPQQAQQAQQPEAAPAAPATSDAGSAAAADSPASTTGAEATSSSSSSDGEPALSGGEIAGIAVGCAAAAALLTLFVWFAFRRRVTAAATSTVAGSGTKGGLETPRKVTSGDEEAPSPVYNISAQAQQLQASSFVNPAFAAEEGAAHNPMFEPSPVKPAEPQP